MAVYLLHSDKAIGTVGRNSASHYIGYSEDENLWQRLSHHADPRRETAKIISAFHRVGATLRLVVVWQPGGRALERYLKSRGKYKSRCPICSGWLTASHFLSLETIRSMTITSGVKLSNALSQTISGKPFGGMSAESSGLSLARPLLDGPTEFGDAIVVLRETSIGGTPSNATAQPKGKASASAGTRQRPSSDANTT